MKILIINGSAHRGNTWKLVEQAKNCLVESQKEIEFDEVHLIDEGLPFCIGCSNCFRVGHEKCPHYNVIGKIIEKIETADGIIIATTTYNMRETALLQFTVSSGLHSVLERPFSEANGHPFFVKKSLLSVC